MRETLEEVHRATMMNPRAAAEYAPLVDPGDPATGRPPQKLCVFVWDSWQVKIQKPGNHKNQRGTYSTKIKGNSLQRMEGVDLEGKPVFALCPSASISPRATDESISFFTLQNEAVTGARGGFTDMLVGLPEYCMVHLWDNGYRYWCILKIVYCFIFLLHSLIRWISISSFLDSSWLYPSAHDPELLSYFTMGIGKELRMIVRMHTMLVLLLI